MPVDQSRYSQLIARAAFNMEAFRGIWQDVSAAQRVMTAVGSPSWSKLNGWPCLRQTVAGDGATSGVVAPVLDATLATTVEVLFVSMISGSPNLLRQVNNGGCALVWDGSTRRLFWELFDNAGALARYGYILIPVPAFSVPVHATITLSAGGGAGEAWLRGIPIAPVFGGAGVPAISGNATVVVGTNTGLSELLLVRLWQGVLGQENATCLAEQAKLLIGGW